MRAGTAAELINNIQSFLRYASPILSRVSINRAVPDPVVEIVLDCGLSIPMTALCHRADMPYLHRSGDAMRMSTVANTVLIVVFRLRPADDEALLIEQATFGSA